MVGVLGAGKAQVQLGDGIHRLQDGGGLHGSLHGKVGQDAAFLIPLGQQQLAVLVVMLHHAQRLDEESGPRGGLVVDDGFDAPLELSPQRDHVAPIALGDDGLLQVLAAVGVAHQALELGHQAVVGHAQVAADGRQLIRGGVEDLAAV